MNGVELAPPSEDGSRMPPTRADLWGRLRSLYEWLFLRLSEYDPKPGAPTFTST
jgi:hypothetical protein